MMRKRIPFFDAEGHSAGSLTSRLSADSTQLQQLMGTEMGYALIAVVNLIGSIAIVSIFRLFLDVSNEHHRRSHMAGNSPSWCCFVHSHLFS